MITSPNSLASIILRGHFSGSRGTTETVLLLVGLAFAGLIVWTIERNGRATTR